LNFIKVNYKLESKNKGRGGMAVTISSKEEIESLSGLGMRCLNLLVKECRELLKSQKGEAGTFYTVRRGSVSPEVS